MKRILIILTIIILTIGLMPQIVNGSQANSDFDIREGVLKKYKGEDVYVTVPDGVMQIGSYAFSDCDFIETIILPEGVIEIKSGAFDSCSALRSITIPDSITHIDHNAFLGCVSLEKIELPLKLKYIGGGAFEDCELLKSIIIPDSVSFIGPSAFKGALSLEGVKLSKNIWFISGETFAGCISLKEISIPSKVIYINKDLFIDCVNLEKVVFEGNAPPILIGDAAIDIISGKAKIYKYKNALGFDNGEWKKYDIQNINVNIKTTKNINSPYDVLGKYFVLGKYNDTTLIWRAVKYDKNGVLLFCDGTIFDKSFNQDSVSNIWRESSLRQWLNSETDGFLSTPNFTENELSAIRRVSLDTYLPESDLDLATKGEGAAFPVAYRRPANHGDMHTEKVEKVKDIKLLIKPLRDGELFHEIINNGDIHYNFATDDEIAMYETTDRIFLPDEWQIDFIYQIFHNISSLDGENQEEYLAPYWLRSPYVKNASDVRYVDPKTEDYSFYPANEPLGVRPLCYIDTSKATILTGNGTKHEPYVINGEKRWYQRFLEWLSTSNSLHD